MFGVEAVFVEEGMSVCWLEIHLGVQDTCLSEIRSFVCNCVQEVDLCFVCDWVQFYRCMVVIECLDKFKKVLMGMGPNAPNVIQVSDILGREFITFFEGCVLPVCHINVCIGWRKTLAHGCAFNLEVVFFIEQEVIPC